MGLYSALVARRRGGGVCDGQGGLVKGNWGEVQQFHFPVPPLPLAPPPNLTMKKNRNEKK